MKDKGKKVETHSIALGEVDVKANNAMIMDNLNPSIDIKGLDVSDFFQDLDEKIDHFIGGGVLGPDN